MPRVLSGLVFLFGSICCLIACVHIAFGPRSIIGSIPVNATMDGEDRFFAALFLGFGAALVWCSLELIERYKVFNALLLIFFVGGVARAIAAIARGWPHPLFIGLGILELALPPLFWIWLRFDVRRATRPQSGTTNY